MTEIRQIAPDQTTAYNTRTPQCSMPFHTYDRAENQPQARERRGRVVAKGRDPSRCAAASVFVVNGKPYCRQHAGEVALRILMMQQMETGK